MRLVEETRHFRAAVREGVAQAEHAELIDDEEVGLCLEQQEHP
jgi:predicted transcriptional regulator